MNKYDYRQAMVNDIKTYITDNNWIENNCNEDDDEDTLFEKLDDELWAEDSITGNGYNYYDTEEKCQEYVASNLTLYFEAADEFCDLPNSRTSWIYKNPAQHMDTTIRCYLLRECIMEAYK